jgi:uncharacterized protein
MKRLVMALIRGYQLTLSGVLGGRCRFYPSCSNYALESVQRFGVLRGSVMSLWRIMKCQPFHPGGFDPVPRREAGASWRDAFTRHKRKIGISRI